MPPSDPLSVERRDQAIVVFAKRRDGRTPGAEGPYLVQAVVHDERTDTYYLRLA
jgi:hypothetical protein